MSFISHGQNGMEMFSIHFSFSFFQGHEMHVVLVSALCVCNFHRLCTLTDLPNQRWHCPNCLFFLQEDIMVKRPCSFIVERWSEVLYGASTSNSLALSSHTRQLSFNNTLWEGRRNVSFAKADSGLCFHYLACAFSGTVAGLCLRISHGSPHETMPMRAQWHVSPLLACIEWVSEAQQWKNETPSAAFVI